MATSSPSAIATPSPSTLSRLIIRRLLPSTRPLIPGYRCSSDSYSWPDVLGADISSPDLPVNSAAVAKYSTRKWPGEAFAGAMSAVPCLLLVTLVLVHTYTS